MEFLLPKIGKKPIPLPHFPTRQQAFIVRAAEYVPYGKIAEILKTDEQTVRRAAEQMGHPEYDPGNQWLRKGTVTILRRLWQILNYEQLLQLLEMDEQTLAVTLREEDFLDVKLSEKPDCAPLYWENLTPEQLKQTEMIRKYMENVDLSGVKPFDFSYDVPELTFSGQEKFKSRIIYGFSGQYLHAFDMDSREFCPDSMLEAYQKIGVNGIWTQGVLMQLAPFPFAPKLSEGYQERIWRMQDFAQRLKKYGMKLYIYLNEPRSMPPSFFEKYPHLRGHEARPGKICLCTSAPEVQQYITDSVASICRAVPELGGFFTITRSENPTNCYSHAATPQDCTCPRCKNRPVSDVIAETIGCMAKGAHQVDPNIKVMAWSWGWGKDNLEIIRKLPKDVILLSQSELHVPFTIGGVSGEVVDYSMSIIGPGDRAKQEWAVAKECGLETGAKVQMNTTWECSTIPALPVYPSIEEHMAGIRQEGVSHLLLSWTLGGYPSHSIAHAARYFYENCSEIPETAAVKQAAECFVEAFREYPFHVETLYNGPQNAGPASLLYTEPTGYHATMTCYTYDDLEKWRSIYPEDVYEAQYKKLCEKWEKGLQLLDGEPDGETVQMAQGAYCVFKAGYNQIRFYRARAKGDKARMRALAAEELEVTQKMLGLMNKNAAIGFEAANHYYYSKGELAEKIVNCRYIMENL